MNEPLHRYREEKRLFRASVLVLQVGTQDGLNDYIVWRDAVVADLHL